MKFLRKREIEIESDSVAEVNINGFTVVPNADAGDGIETGEDSGERDKWKRNIDFIFACLGFSVGFGNVWRFPYLCFKNGGGAFLIPYFISVIVTGLPMFFLEVSVGQLMSRGGIEAWEIVPLFKGVGYAGTFVLFCLNCYYNVILAWIFYYLFSSMAANVPWSNCGNLWNTANCVDEHTNISALPGIKPTDPVNEFWERRVLGMSSGIDDVGTVKWDLALCLLLAWIVVFLCIFRGIRASGWVLYITATLPFGLMIALMARTAMLDGALKGMIYYMKPNFSKLGTLEVWSDAGTQIFFSYSISLGTLTALGSFNNFHHNTVRDTTIFAMLNSFTSLLAGCIIFCTLGYMSESSGVPIEDVAESGPGLAFVAYPKALSTMPLSPLWSVLFFCMLLLLGLDSQFVGVEGLSASIADLFPSVFSSRRPKALLTLGCCIACFFVGLVMVTNGGIYIFQLFDYYVGSRIILLVAMSECIVIGFVFGARKFEACLEKMYNMRFFYLPSIIYCGIVPWFSLVLFIISAIVYGKLEYKRSTDIYEFPQYAVAIGWILACCSIVCVPIVAIYRIARAKGSLLERIKELCQPNLTPSAIRHLGEVNDLFEDGSEKPEENIFATMEINLSASNLPNEGSSET